MKATRLILSSLALLAITASLSTEIALAHTSAQNWKVLECPDRRHDLGDRNSELLAERPAAVAFTIRLAGTATTIYSSGEHLEADIITDASGTLESHLAGASIPIPAGVQKVRVGAVNQPGLFFLRFKAADGSQIVSGLLIFPTGNPSKFTAELITENLKVADLASGDRVAFLKFTKLVNGTRLSAAWKKALPNWISQNMANVGQAAIVCGISTLGTAGAGVLVGCVVPTAGIMADATASVLTQVADDLKTEGKLTAPEVVSAKRGINLINGALQVLTSAGFDRIVSALQAAVSVVVDQTDAAQITGKVVGDGVKKYNFLLQFKPK